MTKQEIIEMIEGAGFDAERDTVYNRVAQSKVVFRMPPALIPKSLIETRIDILEAQQCSRSSENL
jgi:hypothetical protein